MPRWLSEDQVELIRDLWVYVDDNLPLNVEGVQLALFIDDLMDGFEMTSLTYMTAQLVGKFLFSRLFPFCL